MCCLSCSDLCVVLRKGETLALGREEWASSVRPEDSRGDPGFLIFEHINPDVFVFKISVLFHHESDTSSWHTGLPGVEKQTSGALKMIFEPEPRLFPTLASRDKSFSFFTACQGGPLTLRPGLHGLYPPSWQPHNPQGIRGSFQVLQIAPPAGPPSLQRRGDFSQGTRRSEITR